MHLDVSHSFISVHTSPGEGVLTVCIRSYFLQTLHRIMPSYTVFKCWFMSEIRVSSYR